MVQSIMIDFLSEGFDEAGLGTHPLVAKEVWVPLHPAALPTVTLTGNRV